MNIETKIVYQDGTEVASNIFVPEMSLATLQAEAQAFYASELPDEADARYELLRDFLRTRCLVFGYSFDPGELSQFLAVCGEAQVTPPLLISIADAVDAAYPDLKVDLERSYLEEPEEMLCVLV